MSNTSGSALFLVLKTIFTLSSFESGLPDNKTSCNTALGSWFFIAVDIISYVMLLSSIILFKKKEVEITNNEAD